MRGARDLRRNLVIGWVVVTALPLLGLALGIVMEPRFPLGLGFINTQGLTGLWLSLLPAVVGVMGVVMLGRLKRAGAALILVYSAFWVVILAGILPLVWNAESSFCLRGLKVCITAAWLARLIVLSLLVLFVLVSVWSLRRTTSRPQQTAST